MKTFFGPKSKVIFGPNDVFIKSFLLFLTLVIVLSCALIDSLCSSKFNQHAQLNCYIEPDCGDPSICTT